MWEHTYYTEDTVSFARPKLKIATNINTEIIYWKKL